MPTDKDGDEVMAESPKNNGVTAPENVDGEATDAADTNVDANGPSPTERVADAEMCKENGNALLKAGDFQGAAQLYSEGIELTEPLLEKSPEEVGEDLQLRATLAYQALRLNCAQAHIKSGDWVASIEQSDKVLLLSQDHPKALYRRGFASLQLDTEGRLEQARADFVRVAALEPANREVRGLLTKAKERLRELRQAEKERLSAAMCGGLYQEHHDQLGKQQAAYEMEAQRRRDAGEDEISFNDWQSKEKERLEEAKKKEKEEQEKREKEEQDRKLREQHQQDQGRRRSAGEVELSFEDWLEEERIKEEELRKARVGGVVRTDEADLDAEEKALLQETKSKGYYHGRLGTVLSNDAPKPQQLPNGDGQVQVSQNGTAVGSEWNQAGTWEEKDMSAWAKECLTGHLQQTRSQEAQALLSNGEGVSVSAKVSKVKSLSGDAHLVMVRKQLRHGYNYEADVSFSLKIRRDSGEKDESFSGVLSLPEITDSVAPDQLRVELRWKGSSPPAEMLSAAKPCMETLRNDVRNRVAAFREEYQKKR